MPTIDYRIDGVKVPSVTTIIGHRKEAGGLMHWAWRLGTEGKDYRKERDSAANAGTMAHEAIEARFHGTDYDFPTTDEGELAYKGFEAYLEWESQSRVEIFQTETHLTTELLGGFGGTPDALARMNGRLVLLDWKCANATYVDHILQLAAYMRLVGDNLLPGQDSEEAVERSYLLRFGKEYADFHHHYFPSEVLKMGWEAFEHLKSVYDLNKKLRKVCR